ncbi:MAG: type I restriction enzyme HsdR N-terminal domain-containing protein [Hymenobacter sp.]
MASSTTTATITRRAARAPDQARRNLLAHSEEMAPVVTPEETVRQGCLLTLVNEYGYELGQIGEEVNTTGRGAANARADFSLSGPRCRIRRTRWPRASWWSARPTTSASGSAI